MLTSMKTKSQADINDGELMCRKECPGIAACFQESSLVENPAAWQGYRITGSLDSSLPSSPICVGPAHCSRITKSQTGNPARNCNLKNSSLGCFPVVFAAKSSGHHSPPKLHRSAAITGEANASETSDWPSRIANNLCKKWRVA